MKPCISENPPKTILLLKQFFVLAFYTLVLRKLIDRRRKTVIYGYESFLNGSLSHLMAELSLSKSDCEYVRRRFRNEGSSFLTRTLPILGKSLERGIQNEVFQCPSSFKKDRPGSALPALLGSQFRGVFTFDGRLREDADPVNVYIIRQFCYHWYKADMPSDPSLDQKVLDSFVETELELKDLNIVEDSSIRFAKRMIQSVFSNFKLEDLNCKHGPGVAVGVSKQHEKYEKKLAPLASVWMRPISHFFNANDFWDRYDRLPHKSIFDLTPMVDERVNRARVILVPKDSRGPRLISCEPVENQYIQQGIMDFMVNRLENHRITGGQVNFTSQQRNRDLACQASKDQSYSTIDLKEASDRVSVKLVKALFSDALLDALMASRSSSTVLPNGKVVELNKFAPMGSATCFPVLATSIYFVVVSKLVEKHGHTFGSVYNRVFVYGDDIIVPTELVDDVFDALQDVGLVVNKDKSFVNSRFAESCGFDAFDGNDVTPLRMKNGIVCLGRPEGTDPARYVALVKFANNLQRAGFLCYAEWIYSICEQAIGALPYGPSDASYLCRICDSGYAAEKTITEGKVTFLRRRNLKKFPLGGVFKAKQFVPRKTDSSDHVSVYGHLSRVWRDSFDRLDFINPDPREEYGIFSHPRDNVLKDVTVGRDIELY